MSNREEINFCMLNFARNKNAIERIYSHRDSKLLVSKLEKRNGLISRSYQKFLPEEDRIEWAAFVAVAGGHPVCFDFVNFETGKRVLIRKDNKGASPKALLFALVQEPMNVTAEFVLQEIRETKVGVFPACLVKNKEPAVSKMGVYYLPQALPDALFSL